MAGWPSIEDDGSANALREGDLAPVYDTYAPRLFDYCHAMLHDREGAALALHDALITARERGVPEPYHVGLYRLARAECLRRRIIPHADPPGLSDVVRSAWLLLDDIQRETLDLSVRHGMGIDELSQILAMPPQETSLLLAQAESDLDAAFSALVIARGRSGKCPEMSQVTEPLTPETCNWLIRHVATCESCGSQVGKVVTERLLTALPAADLPEDLRERVIATAGTPELAAMRTAIAERGVRRPEPVVGAAKPEKNNHRPLIGVAIAGAAVVITGTALLMLPDSTDHGRPSARHQQLPAPLPGSPSSSAPTTPGAPSPSKTKHSPSPSASHTKKSKGHITAAGSHSPKPPPPSHQPKSPPGPGTLSVAGCHMSGSGNNHSCSITLTAQGGNVRWQVTGASEDLSASGNGYLYTGQSTNVTVTLHKFCLFEQGNGTVSLSPGAAAPVSWNC